MLLVEVKVESIDRKNDVTQHKSTESNGLAFSMRLSNTCKTENVTVILNPDP